MDLIECMPADPVQSMYTEETSLLMPLATLRVTMVKY